METYYTPVTIHRGDIFWVHKSPYRPTTGAVNDNKDGRPAIIVSNDLNNLHAYTLEVVYLTSQPKKDLPTHCTIRSTREVSTALCEQVTTISKEQVGKFIGPCTEEELRMVENCIRISLGLEPQKAETEPEEDEEEDDLFVEFLKVKEREKILRELYNELLASLG